MLSQDAAAFIMVARPDLTQIASWNPNLYYSEPFPVPVVEHWFHVLLKGSPSDPAFRFHSPEEYAAYLGYVAPAPQVPVDQSPAATHLPATPAPTIAEQQSTDSWNTVKTFVEANKVQLLLAAGVLLALRAGWFRGAGAL